MKAAELGARRHAMSLEAPQDVRDEIGGISPVYTAFAQVWGALEPASASRIWQSQQVQQQVSHRITLTFRADVTGEMRLRLGARIFEIRAAYDPDETGRFLMCECWEVRP